jgi:hypothetical protein
MGKACAAPAANKTASDLASKRTRATQSDRGLNALQDSEDARPFGTIRKQEDFGVFMKLQDGGEISAINQFHLVFKLNEFSRGPDYLKKLENQGFYLSPNFRIRRNKFRER